MFRKKEKNQKLAGLWLVGEVVNHVVLYGSKVAEGCSAFQRRSCLLCTYHGIIMKFSGVIMVIANDRSDVYAKGQGQRSKAKATEIKTQLSRFRTITPVDFTYGDEMMHSAWCCLWEAPYWFSRSYVKFQGHTAKKSSISTQTFPVFPDCISSLNSQMAKKWCIKFEVAQKGCPIIFQGHPSNFKVTGRKNIDFDLNWDFFGL